MASFLTPLPDFFVRDHGEPPDLDAATHAIRVDGLVAQPGSFLMQELVARLPHREVVATLQCAGNRREELMAIAPVPGELAWGAQAVGTARWGGISLADLLDLAGVDRDAHHVAFEGLDRIERDDTTIGFGASIALERAVAGDVLLAFEMNGQALPRAHGGPVRVVVPGFIGARSVKWLHHVELRADPSDNHYQANAYKLFPPEATPQDADWAGTPPIEAMQLGAVICLPGSGAIVTAGPVHVAGYATAGGDRWVRTVEVSSDGGTWEAATFLDPTTAGTWVRWRTIVHLAPGHHEIVARATDSAGQTQPADAAARWNFKGYMDDAWHRVTVEAS